DRGAGRERAVHRGADDWELELERVELPGDVDVFRVACPPAGHDGDVVEPVGPSTGLADADLDFQPGTSRALGAVAFRETSRLVLRLGHARVQSPQSPVTSTSTMRARNPVRMRAVAPHTVSSSSS